LQIVLKIFFELHHSQIPIINFSPILNLNAKGSLYSGLNSTVIVELLLSVSALILRAELRRGSRHWPGKSTPLLISCLPLSSSFWSSPAITMSAAAP
jgi:hypothetical protein